MNHLKYLKIEKEIFDIGFKMFNILRDLKIWMYWKINDSDGSDDSDSNDNDKHI